MARVSRRKVPKKEIEQHFERWKIESRVFDRLSVMTLADCMSKGLFETLDFPIAMGKEAVVFRATKSNGEYVAVKIYKVDTSTFIHMQEYIRGDPRFEGIQRKKRATVLAWVRKEFHNLRTMYDAGVHVPRPIYAKNNLLIMQYIGENGLPAPLLKDVGSVNPGRDFAQLVDDLRFMYAARLVHGDLSPFNILVTPEHLVIIDVGQAVDIAHPRWEFFLHRDVRNIVHFFSRYGITAHVEDVVRKITSPPLPSP